MVSVTVSIVMLFAFCIVAIDGPVLMTTKTQLQNGADAAALAGASGLIISQDEATARAIQYAAFNNAVRETLEPIAITDADVTFPTPTRVRVVTHRTAATGDPLRTYFLRILDFAHPNLVDVSASAVAEIQAVCSTRCVKPWAIPDRWDDADGDSTYDYAEDYTDDNMNGTWDPGEWYDDANGNGVWDPDEFYDPILTGYVAPGDVGVPMVLKVGNPQQSIASGQFFPVDYPPLGGPVAPITGGDQYREWIATCSPYLVSPGDSLQLEPGNMVGPTLQGIDDLIVLDPYAYWDDNTNQVEDSAWGFSPRIAIVPLFDPRYPPGSGRGDNVIVAKLGAFFIESTGPGSRVVGRYISLGTGGIACTEEEGNGVGAFLFGIRLVE